MKIFTFISMLTATALASAAGLPDLFGNVGSSAFKNRAELKVAADGSSEKTSPAKMKAPVRDTASEGWITLLEEDFSKMEAGTEDTHDEGQLADLEYKLDEKYFSMPGWTGFGIYQAGGSCAIDYPSYGGMLNTPEMEMKGLVRVSARYKSLDDIRAFTAVICKGGIGMPQQIAPQETVRLFSEDGWETAVYEFYNPYDDAAFLQFNTQYYTPNAHGFLIDDLKIEVLPSYIPPVEEVAAGEFSNGAFKVRWTPSELTDRYLVSLYSDSPAGGNGEIYADDFTTWKADDKGHLTSVPDGWTISTRDWHPTLVDCNGGKALALGRHEEFVEFPSNGGKITSFKATITNRLSKHPKAWGTQCNIWGWDGCKWSIIKSFSTLDMADGDTFTVDLGEWEDAPLGPYESTPHQFRGLYSKLRLMMSSANYGAMMLINDYEMETRAASELKQVIKDKSVTGTQTAFENLDPELDYFVGIKAVTDDYISDETMADAWGIATPEALPAENVTEQSFLARWQPVSHASAYLLSTFSAHVTDTPIKDYVVIGEDFSKASVGNTDFDNPEVLGNEVELFPLDDYTERPGWYGAGLTAVDGWIGASSCRFFPGMYGIQLPIVSVYSGTGDYKVKMHVRGEEGSSIIVMSSTSYNSSETFEATGEYDIEIPMTGGTAHEQLVLITSDGAPFFIDEISVVQDLQAGDAVLTPKNAFETRGDQSSMMITGMEAKEGEAWAYDVMAGRLDFTRHAVSEYSAPVIVKPQSGVNTAEISKGMDISVNGECLTLNLIKDANIEIYDTLGRLVASRRCSAGASDFSLPRNAVYFIKNSCSGKAVKVVM